MAQSQRDIKRRIRSVKSTQKITKAMEMVAAAKLRRSQEKVVAARPYTQKLRQVLGRLLKSMGDFEHQLLETATEGKIGCVVLTGDRGLAGGYNINILRLAKRYIDTSEEETGIVVLDKKGRDFFRFRNYPIERDYINIGDIPSYMQAQELAKQLVEMYEDGTFKELQLFFNRFVSPITQVPMMVQLLPIDTTREGEEEPEDMEYIYEPSPAAVLNELLPKYVEIQVYQAMLEAKASEWGARMTAMGAATDNAGEMIDKLTLSYNRARQAAITKEISEIVGGANALQNG